MRQHLVIAAIAATIGSLYLVEAATIRSVRLGDPLGPKAFPVLLGVGMLLASVVLVLEARRGHTPEAVARPPGQRGGRLVAGAVVAWTALYFWSFEWLGYVAATTLYLFPLMFAFNRRAWLSNGLTAILFSSVSYLLFTRLLDVRLPSGVLPF